jgi:hypothetical protein
MPTAALGPEVYKGSSDIFINVYAACRGISSETEPGQLVLDQCTDLVATAEGSAPAVGYD